MNVLCVGMRVMSPHIAALNLGSQHEVIDTFWFQISQAAQA